MKIGEFVGKVTTPGTLKEKLALPNKGQAWGAGKIDEAIAYGTHPETEKCLKEMKDKHHISFGEKKINHFILYSITVCRKIEDEANCCITNQANNRSLDYFCFFTNLRIKSLLTK